MVRRADTFSRSYSGRCGIPRCPTGIWLRYCPSSNNGRMHSERASALTKTFCKVEDLVDDDGNVLIDQHGDPEVKVPNPRVELPYTTWWHGMHCPSLMMVVHNRKALCHSL